MPPWAAAAQGLLVLYWPGLDMLSPGLPQTAATVASPYSSMTQPPLQLSPDRPGVASCAVLDLSRHSLVHAWLDDLSVLKPSPSGSDSDDWRGDEWLSGRLLHQTGFARQTELIRLEGC
jgi:hypothetical protein